MPSGSGLEARVDELELKLGVSEDQIEELNRTAFRQQQQIDLLQGQLREVYRLLQAADPPTHPRDEKPPHY